MTEMPKVAEYGSNIFCENRSTYILSAEKFSPKLKTNVRLVLISKGYEPAGSAARWTNGCYAVHWDMFGARQGGRYLSLDEAQAHFDRLTA